jgi:bis(5'-nucleosyl)-tetraphosphatase (symmetrical)|tara:strand:+ start:863 stop:1633 length:771 start_codon:yes stop_codon:yes gene_type:complete
VELNLEGYKGLLIVGDVHSVFSDFATSYSYARKHNLYYLQLGDILDYGPKPLESLLLAKEIQDKGYGTIIQGNHDNKMYRWAKGNDVKLGKPQRDTLARVDFGIDLFRDLVLEVVERQPLYVSYKNFFFTHGGIHPEFWETKKITKKSMENVFLYGQVDNSQTTMWQGQQYAHRVYDWAEAIPTGQIVFVGHDRSPLKSKPDFEFNLQMPLVYYTKKEERVIFMDTGSGKGGTLSGAKLTFNNFGQLAIDTFLSFT